MKENFLPYLGGEIQQLFLSLVNEFWGPADMFKSPEMLWFLLIIPIFLVWYVWWYSPRRMIIRLSYDPTKLAPPKINLAWLRFAPMILNMVGILLAVVALARPIAAFDLEERYSEGIDIMLVLDTSGSMETEDFAPNRLEVAKQKAIEFLEGRLDDRIGIVLFAEDAFSYAPLTLDYELLKKQINSINSNIMPKEGTAMGSAIAVSINRMQKSSSPSQIMILLTDGASNRGQIDPLTAADLAKEKGIKVYCIGIGKEEFTRRTMFGSQTIKSDLDEKTLMKIADMTNGKFFRSTNGESLREIFALISQMEKIEIKEERFREEKDMYSPILLVSSFFFALALFGMMSFVYNPLEG